MSLKKQVYIADKDRLTLTYLGEKHDLAKRCQQVIQLFEHKCNFALHCIFNIF